MVKQETYITSLKVKHSDLEKSIAKESSSVQMNSTKISEMKRQKLQLKEEIEKLSKK